MRIYYTNYITDATLTPSSSATGFNVNDLTIPQLANVFRWDGDSETLVIEFSEAKNIKSFIMDKGNLTSNVNITFQANATDVWTSPSYSTSLTETDSMYYKDLDETYQYWRLVISDTTIDKIQLGYIVIGDEYLQMPGISPEVDLYYNTTSAGETSIGGQYYSDEGYQYLETKFSFPQIGEDNLVINGTTLANRSEILAMWDSIQNLTPVWVMLWEKKLDEHRPYFCVISSDSFKMKKLSYGKYYSLSLNLREVL